MPTTALDHWTTSQKIVAAGTARDVIKTLRKAGWAQHRFRKKDGRLCLMGGAQVACGQEPGTAWEGRPRRFYLIFGDWLRLPRGWTVIDWNDGAINPSDPRMVHVRHHSPATHKQLADILTEFANELDPPKET